MKQAVGPSDFSSSGDQRARAGLKEPSNVDDLPHVIKPGAEQEAGQVQGGRLQSVDGEENFQVKKLILSMLLVDNLFKVGSTTDSDNSGLQRGGFCCG